MSAILGEKGNRTMNQEDYLDKVNTNLKTMLTSKRVEVMAEIKNEIGELERGGDSPEQVIKRLGNPEELAQRYLRNDVVKDTSFSWKKFRSMIAFYTLASIKVMFVLPFISILSIALILSGIIAPIGGIVKFIVYLFGYDIPQIGFQIGAFTTGPVLFLLVSIIFGGVFVLLGKKLWRFTKRYVQSIRSGK